MNNAAGAGLSPIWFVTRVDRVRLLLSAITLVLHSTRTGTGAVRMLLAAAVATEGAAGLVEQRPGGLKNERESRKD